MTVGVCAIDKVHLLLLVRAAFAAPPGGGWSGSCLSWCRQATKDFPEVTRVHRADLGSGRLRLGSVWIWMRVDERMDLDVWSNHNHPKRTHYFVPFHKL